ncbi:MAG: SMC-Scp complex subunit ScpB [Verrucomicrobia bacterium]|nr:MAG: SMC-Scp complex subunit ScpB [Verrucomicrobiota bacterium]
MELQRVIEALVFASQKPLTVGDLVKVLRLAGEADDPDTQALKDTKPAEVEAALRELAAATDAAGRSYRLVCLGGAWQYVTRPEFAPWLQAMVGERPRPARLSQPALETLTIIAYRQPVTRAEIEEIRGVSVDGVMQTLLERGLIEVVGRAETPGRPSLYGTTRLFLEAFGLQDLSELPAADELRRLVVETPAEPAKTPTSAGETAEAPPAGADTPADAPDSGPPAEQPDAPEPGSAAADPTAADVEPAPDASAREAGEAGEPSGSARATQP